uniref:Uncharacterized protein n=1 Tax=Arundo donax TaxID=35708 RepID=A0A0A9FH84_ARUDO
MRAPKQCPLRPGGAKTLAPRRQQQATAEHPGSNGLQRRRVARSTEKPAPRRESSRVDGATGGGRAGTLARETDRCGRGAGFAAARRGGGVVGEERRAREG